MRLKSIYIGEYKNLKDFTLNFNTACFIDIFVGKNASGKSNLFEAIIEIFRHLYEFDKKGFEINFDYKIQYEIDGKSIDIKWEKEKLEINGEERKTIGDTFLPDNILIYYSGHNKKVSALVAEYEKHFKDYIQGASIAESRKFIGVKADYKQLLLSILLIQNEESKAKKFICKKLDIETIDNLLRIVLKRPFYAKTNKFDVDKDDPKTKYWKAKGITVEFLLRLDKCLAGNSTSPIRTEGYFDKDNMDYPDKYVLFYDIDKLQNEFSDISLQELFRNFDNLKTLEMLEDISIQATLSNGAETKVDYFSDGQYQSVYIYSIIELFKDSNCLTLLDEPDSFLHPEWQFEFLKQVLDITNGNKINNHVLICSHSAITLIPHTDKKVYYVDLKGNFTHVFQTPKHVAVKKMGSKLFKLHEEESILSIVNAINIERKPVLFTEGHTDPIILKVAWFKLYDEDIPFIPFYAFRCSFLQQLLLDEKIHVQMRGLPVFGLFDFDEAYNFWIGLKGKVLIDDPFKGLARECEVGNSFGIMIPIPNNATIRRQVIKNYETLKTFEGKSCCTIEHLFYGSKFAKKYFIKEPSIGGGEKIIFKSVDQKVKFATDIIPLIEDEYFEVLRPIFEFIKSKI